mgnify:CR=1 FL=1
MNKLNDTGKAEIKSWLKYHHINGSVIMTQEWVLSNWYRQAEIAYATGVNYPIIMISAGYALQTKQDVYLLIQDCWIDIIGDSVTIDDRIGINDQVNPELFKKRVRDWC